MRKRVLVLAVAFLLLLSGLAMAYPTRNITFVIPFNPGGATDVELSPYNGVKMVF